MHVLHEPELKPWDVTSHIVVGQARGSEVAALSSCIVLTYNTTLKSVVWEHLASQATRTGLLLTGM